MADEPQPKSRALRAVETFTAMVNALRGGGVWAALTLCLLVAGWQAWRIEQLNQQIIDILIAARQTDSEKPTRFSARVDLTKAAAEPVHAPRRVLDRYHELYRPQVEQRVIALPMAEGSK